MNEFIKAAKELIYPNAVRVTYKSISTGAYNLETGLVEQTTTETPLKAFPKVLKPSVYSYPNLVGKSVSEWLVVASDVPSIPKPLDKIVKGLEVFTVETHSEHVACGEVIMYKIIAIKG